MSNQTFRTLLVAFFMILFVLPVMAQQATLKGQLFNDADGTTLPFATIIVGDTGAGTTTDFDGNYELQLDAGTHNITFEYIGLTAKTESVTLTAGEMKDLSVRLGESAELLEQVVVTANKSGVKIGESTVSIAVVKPDLLNNTNSDSDEIVQKVPGVNVIDGQANIRGGSGYSYGAGSRVLLLVDDLPFLAGDAGFPNWSDIPIENAGQVEVLKGAASSLYGSSAMNGIINFKTAYPTSETYTRISLYNTNYFPPAEESIMQGDTSIALDRRWWDNDDSRRNVLIEEDSVTLNKPTRRGLQFAHRQKFGKFDLVLGGVLYDDHGFRQFERDRKARLNFNTRYRITDKFSIGVNGNINRGSSVSYFLWQNPNEGSYESFQSLREPLYTLSALVGVNPDFTTTTPSETFRYNIDPFLTIFDEKGNRHKILSRYYHINNDNGNNQANTSDLLYGEYQFQRTFQGSGINLVAGVLGQKTFSEAQLYGNANYTSSNVGAYAQIDKRFADKLTVSFGSRYEINTITSPEMISSICHVDTLNPRGLISNPDTKSREAKPVFRAGINYQPAEYTYLRASWGQGYRFPTIAERYVSTSVGDLLSICPNPILQSETGWSAEIGLRQGVKISSWQGFIDLSGFMTEYQDMMEFTFGGADINNRVDGFQSGNIDDTRIRGAEISFLGQGELFGVPTNLIAGYTYIDPTYQNFTDQTRMNSTSNENILKYRFRHTAKLDIESTIKKRFSLGLSVQYNSKMEALDIYFYDLGNFLLEPYRPTIEAFGLNFEELAGDILGIREFRERNDRGTAVVDIRAAYNISDVAKISFILKNATNQTYTLRPALMEAPMNLTVRADVTFRGKAKN